MSFLCVPSIHQLLLAIYSDESQCGLGFKSLIPCCLGTLIEARYLDSATDLVIQLVTLGKAGGGGGGDPDYSAAGWCLAQQVFFGRVDWAAAICGFLRGGGQAPPWYSEQTLMQSIASWGGDDCARQVASFRG